MIVSSHISLDVDGTPMPCYLSRPADAGQFPAVIVLEGVYGFDDELRRITDLVASTGYVGLAIDYFYRAEPRAAEPFTPEGRRRGEERAKSIRKSEVRTDVEAARDWLNVQPFVDRGHIATLGFGLGGTVAFVTATVPGILAATAFYGQSITSLMPSGEPAPLEDAKQIRAPLLLIFGGKDELISARDIDLISRTLRTNNKNFDVQLYPNVGHSFFRTAAKASVSAAEAADAWDRLQAFLRRNIA